MGSNATTINHIRRSIFTLYNEQLLINLFVIISLILLASAFIYQTRNKNRKARNLSIGIVIAIIAQIIYAIVLATDASPIQITATKHLRDLLFAVFYYLIYLHYESLSREKPNLPVFAIITGLLVINLAFFVLFLINPSSLYVSTMYVRFTNVIGLVIWFYVTTIVFQVFHKIFETQVLIELLAVFLIFVAHIIYVLGDNSVPFIISVLGNYENLADTLSIIGALSIFINYLANIDYLYRTPVPVHQILAYNTAGTPVYNEHVFIQGFQEEVIQEFLFSGIITAITSVMKESIGYKSELKRIESNEHTFLFQHTKNISIVLLTSNTTQFLLKSLKLLGDLLSEEIATCHLANMEDYTHTQKTIGKLIKKAFPYIVIPDLSKN